MTDFYSGKNILVTGGGGFIGSHLVEQLLQLGAHVTVAQRTHPHRLNSVFSNINYIKADLADPKACQRAVSNIDIVFDLAARLGTIEENTQHPASLFHQNTTRFLNMLEAARIAGVERYLCASSNAIYSPDNKIPFQELDGFINHPDATNLGYGWSKRVAEIAAGLYVSEYAMNIMIARIGNTYGPRDCFTENNQRVIPALIQKVYLANDSVEVWGDGEQIRSFLYVKDAVDGLLTLVERSPSGQTYNLDSDQEVTIKALITEIIRLSERPLEIAFNASKPTGQIRKTTDITKIKTDIGWQPRYSLTQGLSETIEWYLAQAPQKNTRSHITSNTTLTQPHSLK